MGKQFQHPAPDFYTVNTALTVLLPAFFPPLTMAPGISATF
jgi:hypothetical protein